MSNDLKLRIAGLEAMLCDAQREVEGLRAELQRFADAYRMAKKLGVSDRDDISFPVPALARAAELVPEC